MKLHNNTQKYTPAHTALLLLCLLLFSVGIFPPFAWCSLALFALALIGFYLKIADLFLLGLMCGAILLVWRTDPISRLLVPPLPLASALGRKARRIYKRLVGLDEER